MNRSKSAAVLMLFGAFAVGGGGTYAGLKFVEAQRSAQPDCPPPQQPRSESNFRTSFYQKMGFDELQKIVFDSLIDYRNKAVSEVTAAPRAKAESVMAMARAQRDSILAAPQAAADSIRKAIREQQDAVFTPDQKAILDAQRVAMDQRRAERDAQRAQCAMQAPNPQQAKSPSTKSKSNNNH